MLAVPSLTKRPLVALTGLAVLADLGVLSALNHNYINVSLNYYVELIPIFEIGNLSLN